MNNLEKYLKPTEFFNFDNRKVREKALEITNGLETDKEKAVALFYWVRDKIKYNMMSFYMLKYNFKASVTLRRKYGFCVSKSLLLSSFARAVGIPARIHLVDIINHKIPQKVVDLMRTNTFFYHGYSELFIDGKWIKAAPIFDKNTSIKGGFFPMIEFDGENHALFSHYDLDGNLFVEYINDRGIHADLPYEDIDRVMKKEYNYFYESSFSLESFRKKPKEKEIPMTYYKSNNT